MLLPIAVGNEWYWARKDLSGDRSQAHRCLPEVRIVSEEETRPLVEAVTPLVDESGLAPHSYPCI